MENDQTQKIIEMLKSTTNKWYEYKENQLILHFKRGKITGELSYMKGVKLEETELELQELFNK